MIFPEEYHPSMTDTTKFKNGSDTVKFEVFLADKNK